MSKGLVNAGIPARPDGEAGPLTDVSGFAKRKLEMKCE
jgi:hypothetical protein